MPQMGPRFGALQPLNCGVSLGQKGDNPFLHISGCGHIRKPFGLQLHLLGKWSLRRAVNETFDSFVSPRRGP
jgi:hypothetical protein